MNASTIRSQPAHHGESDGGAIAPPDSLRERSGQSSNAGARAIPNETGWSARRAVWRMTLIAPVMAVGTAGVWSLTLLPLPSSLRVSAVNALVTTCSRFLLRALNVRVQMVGRLPSAPMLLAGNHLSWIDILAAKSLWPEAHFIAKEDVARWPVVGRITRAAGTLYVDRARRRDLLRSIPALHESLRSGRSVLLFAEGTTTDGSETLAFKSSLFEGAIRAQVPVLPVTFRANTGAEGAPVSTHVCWWGETSLLAHLPRVAGVRRIEFTVRIGEPITPGTCRKLLARRAHLAVQRAARHSDRS